MLENIRKKIITIALKITSFFKENLAQLVLLLILLQLLLVAKDLPFINLINNFEYYSLALLLFLAMVFFRVAIPNRKVIYLILGLFVLAFGVTVVDFSDVNTVIGFVIFILLFFVVSREILRRRKELKKEING